MTAERIESFRVTKSFAKFMELPHMLEWKVSDQDVMVTGRVLSYFRSKGFFLDSLSSLKGRPMTLTKKGFLLIYEKQDRGLVVDLRTVKRIITTTDMYKSRKTSFKRCHIKLKFAQGNIHLFLIGEQIAAWRNAICTVHESNRKACPHEVEEENSPSPVEETLPAKITQGSSHTARNQTEQSTVSEWLSGTSEPTDSEDDTNSGMITVIERPPVELPSLRRGRRRVSSMRQILENDLMEELRSKVSTTQKTTPAVVSRSNSIRVPGAPKKEPAATKNSFSFFYPAAQDGETESARQSKMPVRKSGKAAPPEEDPTWWQKSLRC
ncbi:unnamed protein product [Caenorhabditis auriculariae]|uniref:DUF7778 domain-containing protein n=1 Tax=Caenorhabditis auriculariae TaxID=2777116 RepID=A0A8S1HT46_9PELO|nr:unnamed protein product [Caenorhabditis auriculariae]